MRNRQNHLRILAPEAAEASAPCHALRGVITSARRAQWRRMHQLFDFNPRSGASMARIVRPTMRPRRQYAIGHSLVLAFLMRERSGASWRAGLV